MLTLPASVRIFLARDPVDLRKAFDGLCAVARDVLAADPFSGHLFVFFNRRRDRVKILVWDRNGFWLFYKRLERGTFDPRWQAMVDDVHGELSPAEMHLLLDGVEQKKIFFRKHFSTPLRIYRCEDDRSRATGPASSQAAPR